MKIDYIFVPAMKRKTKKIEIMQNYTIQILGTYITRVFTAESEKIAKSEAREWVATINKNLKTKIIKIN